MAKVEIEDRAFNAPKLKTAVSKCRVSGAVILGYAAILWRHSQQAGSVTASKDDILAWLDCDRFAKPEKAFDWLLAAGLLEKTDDEKIFSIDGNSWRVPRIANRIENAKAAVRAREEKKSSIDSISDGSSSRSSSRSSKRYPDRETGRQRDRETGSKPPIPPSGDAGFKSRAMGLIGKLMAAPPEAFEDDALLSKVVGDDWPLFLKRFPKGGRQFFDHWQTREKQKTPHGVITSQLRDTFIGFLAADEQNRTQIDEQREA